MAAKRRVEFLAGRYCAQNAIAALGRPPGRIEVGRDRAPSWPRGVVGAITHAGSVAMAVVANDCDYQGIGVDVEQIMSRQLALEVMPSIVLSVEREMAERLNISPSLFTTTVFSAKESLFKAVYPSVNKFFGFEDAEIVSVDAAFGRFNIRLNVSLSPAYPAGLELPGAVTIVDEYVMTMVWRRGGR